MQNFLRFFQIQISGICWGKWFLHTDLGLILQSLGLCWLCPRIKSSSWGCKLEDLWDWTLTEPLVILTPQHISWGDLCAPDTLEILIPAAFYSCNSPVSGWCHLEGLSNEQSQHHVSIWHNHKSKRLLCKHCNGYYRGKYCIKAASFWTVM